MISRRCIDISHLAVEYSASFEEVKNGVICMCIKHIESCTNITVCVWYLNGHLSMVIFLQTPGVRLFYQ